MRWINKGLFFFRRINVKKAWIDAVQEEAKRCGGFQTFSL